MEKPLYPSAIRACKLHIAKKNGQSRLQKVDITRDAIRATDNYTLLQVGNDGAKNDHEKDFPDFTKAIPYGGEIVRVSIDVKYLWRMAESLRILSHAKRMKGEIDPYIVKIDIYGSDEAVKFTMGDDVVGVVMPILM